VGRQQSVLHKPLSPKPLMDCISLASFVHTHVSLQQLSTTIGAKTAILRKCRLPRTARLSTRDGLLESTRFQPNLKNVFLNNSFSAGGKCGPFRCLQSPGAGRRRTRTKK